MMARDILNQIVELSQRRGYSSPEGRASIEIAELTRKWMKEPSLLFSDFFPIRAVTLVEVFFEGWVRRLVDHGEPFLLRAEPLCRGLKFDYLLSAGLAQRQLTVGDLVAHSGSLNSATKIVATFEILLDKQFKSRIVERISQMTCESERQFGKFENWDVTLKLLDRLYQIRHVVVHELPRKRCYSMGEVGDILKNAANFVGACENVFLDELSIFNAETQAEMNAAALDAWQAEVEKMEKAANLVAGLEGFDSSQFRTSQVAWVIFAEAESDFVSSEFVGGTMRGMIYSMTLAELCKKRRIELEKFYQRQLESQEKHSAE